MGRRALVRMDGRAVGVLEEIEGGYCRFRYLPEWLSRPDAQPVSLTLPLGPEPYESSGVLPFFENLLPQGWLLEISTKALRLPKDDVIGLLLHLCRDCVGWVEITPWEGS